MATDSQIVTAEALTEFTTEVLNRAGMPADDAAFSAQCFVQTNLWGIDSHGVLRLIRCVANNQDIIFIRL